MIPTATNRIVLAILLAGCSMRPLHGQTVGNMGGGIQHTNTSMYMYRVKLIDEFIERFNDEPQSYIRQRSQELTGTDSLLNRKRMLRALFYSGATLPANASQFIDDVCRPGNEKWLHFAEADWYAEADCYFRYKGKNSIIPLTLHIHTHNDASWWMITGVGNTQLANNTACPAYEPIAAQGRFIPASAHGTNYVVLSQLLQPGMSMEDVMEPEALRSANGRWLARCIQGGVLEFSYVSSVRFHFFQIPGWYFTVTHQRGSATQSGWLISNLRAVTDAEKTTLRQMLPAY